MRCPGTDEGDDARILHWLICPLQRMLSYHDLNPPVLEHRELVPGVTLWFSDKPKQWYRVLIVNLGNGKYFHARAGYRYDVNWKGYIFPSFAFKETENPNPY